MIGAHGGRLLGLVLKGGSSEVHAVRAAPRGPQGAVGLLGRSIARTPGRRGPAKEKHRFPLFKARRCLSAFCAVQKRCGSLAAPPKLGCLVPGVAFCGNNRGVSVIVRVFWLAKRS